jgi:hypothetical protein
LSLTIIGEPVILCPCVIQRNLKERLVKGIRVEFLGIKVNWWRGTLALYVAPKSQKETRVKYFALWIVGTPSETRGFRKGWMKDN